MKDPIDIAAGRDRCHTFNAQRSVVSRDYADFACWAEKFTPAAIDEVEHLRAALQASEHARNEARRFLDAEIAANTRNGETNRKVLDLLGIAYPGLCTNETWGGGVVEGIEELQRERDDLKASVARLTTDLNLAGPDSACCRARHRAEAERDSWRRAHSDATEDACRMMDERDAYARQLGAARREIDDLRAELAREKGPA